MILEHIISKMVVIAFNFFHSKIKTWNPPTKFQLYKSKVEQNKNKETLMTVAFANSFPLSLLLNMKIFSLN